MTPTKRLVAVLAVSLGLFGILGVATASADPVPAPSNHPGMTHNSNG